MTTLDDRLRELWSFPADGEAIWHGGRWHTWSEVTSAADAVTATLGAAGLDADVPLVVALENQPGVVATILGSIASGRRIRFINAMQSSARLAGDLERLAPGVLVLGEALHDRIDPLPPQVRVVVLHADGTVRLATPGDVPDDVTTPEGAEHAGSLEMFTSGTTGVPKRITLRMSQIESTMSAVFKHHGGSDGVGKKAKSPAIVSTPIAHIGGLWGVLQSLVTGRPFVLLERFRLEEWVEVVRTHRPKTTGLPPAALRMIYEANVPVEALESIRAIVAGTAPLEPDFVDAFVERYGIPILNVYGATEFTGAVAGWSLPLFHEWWSAKRGSVGRPQPGVEMRVVAEDDPSDEPVPTGTSGVLQLRTAQTGHREWVRTTDRARIDADGFVWIEGRTDDMIIRGGFKVDPDVVRAALEKHPAVAEAAVYPLPDRRVGHVPVAAVELTEGQPAPDGEELRDFCRETLTAYEVPTRIKVLDTLPRTAAMKVSAQDVLALFDETDDALVARASG
ncbi:MAG: hypothetical protein JWP31_2731 [Aeromicrobium sp.]|nr:hypothetical protein [Aeromicrobium sp.]